MKMLTYILTAIIITVGGPGVFLEANAMDVTLQWDANTEPDLAGYKVYYDWDSGAPYEGALGTVNGVPSPSPIDVGNVVTFTFTVPDGVQYFVVTAYDNEDPVLESDYSNEVFVSPGAPASPKVNVNVTVIVTIN